MDDHTDEPATVDEFVLQHQLIRLGYQLINRRNDDLLAHGLTASQSDALFFFAAHPGGLVQDLSAHLHVTHQAAQKVVMKMRRQGILRMKVSPTDARAHQLYLTTSGRHLMQELTLNGTVAGQELLRVLTPEQQEDLKTAVDILLSACTRTHDDCARRPSATQPCH